MSLINTVEVIKLLGISPNFNHTIKYRAEGNANIVLEIIDSFQVIRFKKTQCSKVGTVTISKLILC